MKIKTGDTVKVTTGKDRGKTGKVIQIFPKDFRIIVEGVRIVKRHIKSRKQGEKGQTLTLPGALHASVVMLVCPKCGKATRVGFATEGKTKVRICRKCKQTI